VSWVDANGIHDVETVTALCSAFDIHALSVEDILDPEGRAKAEYYDDYLYVVVKMLRMSEDALVTEQVSLFLGVDYVITFQERQDDVFDPVRKRLLTGSSRTRTSGADYLAYRLMDCVVDEYHVVFDQLATALDAFDALPVGSLPRSMPTEVHRIRRKLMHLRRSVLPLRDAVGALSRADSGFITDSTRPFLRDLGDNVLHVLESIDLYRELSASLLALYQTQSDARLNREMRVLTVFATIFIPLSFVTGFFGMNFDDLPGIHWAPGVWVITASMGLFSAAALMYSKRKDWL
jgi:magnesium transporter